MAIVSKLKKKKKKKKKNKLKKKAVKDGSIAKKVCDLYHKILLICNHHYDFCVVVI
jgi:regulator of replication initiation timing